MRVHLYTYVYARVFIYCTMYVHMYLEKFVCLEKKFIFVKTLRYTVHENIRTLAEIFREYIIRVVRNILKFHWHCI